MVSLATVNGSAVSVQELKKVGRKQRRPSHSFQLKFRPWQIQPFLIAPVLPGETMKNLLLQARVVTDPVKNPLIGWWSEFYLFYVKLRDLPERDLITDMIVTNAAPTPFLATEANRQLYTGVGDMDYVSACLTRVVDEYFRDEEEEGDTGFSIGGLPVAQIGNKSWLDSVVLDSATEQPGETLPGDSDAFPQEYAAMNGFAEHYAHWEAMRSMQLTTVDFEDWLRTFGVNPPAALKEESHKPELLRYVRDWTYPTASGTYYGPEGPVPASMASWSIAERADKDRFFAEPGFVFGVTVCRPKVYLSKQTSAAVGVLNDAFSWLPAILQDQPYTSLKKLAADKGPIRGVTGEGYWLDLRDLFMHGDQFVNFDLAVAQDGNTVVLPKAGLLRRFASSDDADALFSTLEYNELDNVIGGNTIRADGRCDLSILSRIEDTSL